MNFAHDVVDRLANETRAGLLFIDEFGHRRDYSFAEICAQSQRYAAVLRAFGIRPGERVALRTSNTAKNLFALLALDRLGAVPVLCMETWSDEEVVETVASSQATTVLANRKYRAGVDALRGRLPDLRNFIVIGEEQEGWARLDALVTRAQPYAGVENVSGDRALYEAAVEARELLEIVETDRVWCTFAMGSADWIVHAVMAPWSCGAAIVVHEGAFDARERLELARELEVTVLLQTPDEYEAVASLEGIEPAQLPRLRRNLSGVRLPQIS